MSVVILCILYIYFKTVISPKMKCILAYNLVCCANNAENRVSYGIYFTKYSKLHIHMYIQKHRLLLFIYSPVKFHL